MNQHSLVINKITVTPCGVIEMGQTTVHNRTWMLLPAPGWHFVCKPLQAKYLYYLGQYSKLWIRKCHMPVAQRLEHSFGMYEGSSVRFSQWCVIFHNFDCFKNNLSKSKMGPVFRTFLIFCVKLYKEYMYIYIYVYWTVKPININVGMQWLTIYNIT